ncbi:hypothetical protein BOX15_Mlig003387g2 [Macrostomum lignano]|uniref:Uncharacterized protein n=1 Tax=Macrostomum lignano TaxID=282301 RepID=A0A267DU56_9PLAT|nr:hypothetical protein BOX15_Mlig003387g2 [Macrostomum lignano]
MIFNSYYCLLMLRRGGSGSTCVTPIVAVTVMCLLCGDAAACGATNRCGLEGEACYLFYGYSSYGGINYNSKCCDGLKCVELKCHSKPRPDQNPGLVEI